MSTTAQGTDALPTKADFDACDWEGVIAALETGRRECYNYAAGFMAKLHDARVRGDERCASVYRLLEAVTFMQLGDDKDEPFQATLVFTQGRSTVPSDLSPEALALLADLAPDVQDPELRSRFADLLWVCRRDYRMARLAVNAYLASAQVLEDPEQWSACACRIRRAVQVAASLGKQEMWAQVLAFIEVMLDKYDGTDPLFLSQFLMDLLLEQRYGDSLKYAALADKAATRAENAHNWHLARAYLDVMARWQLSSKDAGGERATRLRVADTFVQEAEYALAQPGRGYLIATRFIELAIGALRQIAGTEVRREELHQHLLAYQQRAIPELKRISTSFDPTEIVQRAEQAVAGKLLLDALFELALLGQSPSVAYLEQQVVQQAKDFPLSHLFAGTVMNRSGKTVARKPSMLAGDPDQVAQAKLAEMHSQARFYQQVHAMATVLPAIRQIVLEHRIEIPDLVPIVQYSPFVPPGREVIYARGLLAGIRGDFLVAIHLLIPQVEHSIRFLLANDGVITSSFTADGIQVEYNINQMLVEEKFAGSLKQQLGEDIVFDLRGLLIEHGSWNLRNRMAHGLLNDDEWNSAACIYLWWLVLRLCCFPLINPARQPQHTAVAEEASTPPADGSPLDSATDTAIVQDSAEGPTIEGNVGS